jgi:hypothetical protein
VKSNVLSAVDRNISLESFAAELTSAAYPVALRHGSNGSWLDLELALWKALAETVKNWQLKLQRCE